MHPPPDSTWGRRGHTPFALADGPSDDRRGSEDLVIRYLTAYGPASVKDIQAWSGLTRLRAVVDVLRPRLRVFHDDAGRELFDLPDAPRPGPEVEAPVRFLAALDNVLFGYHDRTRIVDDEHRPHIVVEAPVTVDGFVRGLWRIRRDSATATVVVRLLAPLTATERAAMTDEAARLARFAAPDEYPDLRLLPIDTPWPAGTPWDCSGLRPP